MSNNPFTPERIAASEALSDLTLSPDATKVLYNVRPAYKSEEHGTAALWIADVGKAESARQLTSGLFNDHAGRFHPDGDRVIFLSDRHKAGGPDQLYSIRLDGGEASPIFGKDNKKAVSSFQISPNGRFIAFASADEPSAEDEKKEKDRDDVKVFGEKKGFERLRLYTFASGSVRTLGVHAHRHITSFTWKPDSSELLFTTIRQAEPEFYYEEIPLERILVAEGDFVPQRVGTYPWFPRHVLWVAEDMFVSVQSFEPALVNDASAVFVRRSGAFAQAQRYYGEDEDANVVKDMRHNGLLGVEIVTGVDRRIDVLGAKGKVCTLYQSKDEDVEDWDARALPDGSFVFVGLVSSAPKQKPTNIWCGKAMKGGACTLSTKLSSHKQWMDDAPAMKTDVFRWTGEGGVELEGIIAFPPGVTDDQLDKPLPTVLLIHGG